MPETIAKKSGYILLHDPQTKTVSLAQEAKPDVALVTAKFVYDNSDGAAVLSDFNYLSDMKGLVKITADMISDFLSGNRDRCKLFCYAGNHQAEFKESDDYRSRNIERLMLRETPIHANESDIKLRNQVKILKLDAKTVTANTISQMTVLLKNNAYWASDVDEKYTEYAVRNSECMLAIDRQENIVGFVRFISNNDVAYLSDMVVDSRWRKQQIGTALMQQTCRIIDSRNHRFSALISAKEGDGQAAAPKLYGSKFGFKDYNHSHEQNVYFRYIRITPEKEMQYAENSNALFKSKRKGPDLEKSSESTKKPDNNPESTAP